jgi:hypothetical protein
MRSLNKVVKRRKKTNVKFSSNGKMNFSSDHQTEDAPLIVPDADRILGRKARKDMKTAKFKQFLEDF